MCRYFTTNTNRKLRQGDPFTDSFNVCLENIPAKHKKVKKTKDTPHHNKVYMCSHAIYPLYNCVLYQAMSSQVRRGLKDVTNYRV